MDAISQTTSSSAFSWIKMFECRLKFQWSLFLINNIPALVQIMAWRRPGDKPLSEPMMVSLATHICVTRPQWFNNDFRTWLLIGWWLCCQPMNSQDWNSFKLTWNLTWKSLTKRSPWNSKARRHISRHDQFETAIQNWIFSTIHLFHPLMIL